jgi:N-acetylglucosaminyldiphosphoundecaprenol N-acetyl-beta-D-mannosaminyltransferase
MSTLNSAKIFPVDNYDLDSFAKVAAGFGQEGFGYVVTPNADHLIRWHLEESFRRYYSDASFILLDSRFLALLFRSMNGERSSVCPGSDLTERLLSRVISPQDRVVLIGAEACQARTLEARYGLRNLHHFNPPQGFANDQAAIEECLAYIERQSPFRFCLLAVGTPRQEMLAQALHARGKARGLVFCVGASVNFLSGKEKRAPPWMRRLGFEWLYRLMSQPTRLGHRYLVRGPRVFTLVPQTRLAMRQPAPPGVR